MSEPVVVVDGRSAEAYAREHIPGAVNLPHREISAETTEPLDKSRLYVCYCGGIGCNASTKTALKLLTLGFRCESSWVVWIRPWRPASPPPPP